MFGVIPESLSSCNRYQEKMWVTNLPCRKDVIKRRTWADGGWETSSETGARQSGSWQFHTGTSCQTDLRLLKRVPATIQVHGVWEGLWPEFTLDAPPEDTLRRETLLVYSLPQGLHTVVKPAAAPVNAHWWSDPLPVISAANASPGIPTWLSTSTSIWAKSFMLAHSAANVFVRALSCWSISHPYMWQALCLLPVLETLQPQLSPDLPPVPPQWSEALYLHLCNSAQLLEH